MILIWGKENTAHINRIYKLQSRVCKVILDIPFRDKSPRSKHMWAKLKIMPFKQRYIFHIAVQVFKILNDLCPVYMKSLINTSKNTRYALRSESKQDLCLTARPSTRYYKETFEYNAMIIWNTIPLNIRRQTKLNCFKRKLKTYLLKS